MNDIHSFSLPSYRPPPPDASVAPAEILPRHHGLTILRDMIATWGERIRFRWDLAQRSKANPHLIDDIGLTKQQVEAEIVKPFWRR